MITIYTVLVIGAIIMQAFFTATEMSFTSANKLKLRSLAESGDQHAAKLMDFLGKEGTFLGTSLVGTNIAVILNSVLATRIFIEYFGTDLAPLFTTCVMVPVTLIFGEITPKIIARQYATSLSLRLIEPLSAFFKLVRPVIIIVNAISRFLLSPFGARKKPWDFTFTKSDLKRLLLLGHETGDVNADEVEMIHKVLDFGGKTVENIMIPMYRVSSAGIDDTVESIKKIVALTGFSRIPVYEGDKENIKGVVNIYEVLFSDNVDENAPLKEFLRNAVHIDKDDGLDIALTRLRYKKQQMGIVTGEGRKSLGIVTIEDILEEIVGELEDKR